jgi:hypothetical protein
MVVFILAFILVMPGMGQQKMNEAAKKKEKIERSYKKSYAKARKKTIKHRRAIQTDATKERMDKVDNRARENNRQNDPGFIERYFKKKRPPKK